MLRPVPAVSRIRTGKYERERIRLVVTLRQIADCVEAMPVAKANEALRLVGPAEELFRSARLVFERPFGE